MSPIFAEACGSPPSARSVDSASPGPGSRNCAPLAPADLPRLDAVTVDTSVLAFSALAGLAAAVLFGLTPALRASRPRLMNVLRGIGRNTGLGSGSITRNVVVTAEVALSFVLLVGSGLMFRSFLEFQRIDPGFDSRNMLTFVLNGNDGAATPAANAAFVRQIEDRLRAIPRVESVTGTFPFPAGG